MDLRTGGSVAPFISGSAPATAGPIRLSYGDRIDWRNSDNTANIEGITIDTFTSVNVLRLYGPNGPFITSNGDVGFGTSAGLAALPGSITLAGDASFIVRNPTATTQRGLLSIGATAVGTLPFFGGVGDFAGAGSGTVIAVNTLPAFAGNFLDFQKGGVSNFSVSHLGAITMAAGITIASGSIQITVGSLLVNSGSITCSGTLIAGSAGGGLVHNLFTNQAAGGRVIIGTTPGLTGILGLPNNTYIVERNAANSADVVMIGVDTNNRITFYGFPGPLSIDAAGHLLFGTGAAAPTVAVGAGAGAGATASITGSDTDLVVTLNTAGAPAAGVLLTVTFGAAWPSAPKVVFSPANANAANTVLATFPQPFIPPAGDANGVTTTTFVIQANAAALTGTTYKWSVHCFSG